jgi:hypothetical protein
MATEGDSINDVAGSSLPIDVIVYIFSDRSANIRERNFTDLISLGEFFDPYLQASPSDGLDTHVDILLLINDISEGLFNYLRSNVSFRTSTYREHTRGRVNRHDRGDSNHKFHANELQRTLFDRIQTDDDSITWWKLFSHSRAGYIPEKEALDDADADMTKIFVPHFVMHIADTYREAGPNILSRRLTHIADRTKGVFKKDWWRSKLGIQQHGAYEITTEEGRSEQETEEPEQNGQESREGAETYHPDTTRKVHKLGNHTYRAHQVITNVYNDRWGCASEERVTLSEASTSGANLRKF